jgi:hypothetical protein
MIRSVTAIDIIIARSAYQLCSAPGSHGFIINYIEIQREFIRNKNRGFQQLYCWGQVANKTPGLNLLSVDMVSTSATKNLTLRFLQDLHVRQHGMIPHYIPRPAPSSSSQNDEPFSYWNMGRFQRSTTTSSMSQVAAAPDNFVKKRNADSNGFLPLKFRKLSRAG